MHNQWHRLPDYATVFQAEIVAIAEAAKYLLSLNPSQVNYVKIFIDFQAAIAACANPRIRSRTVEEAVKALNELATRTKSLTLVWIPAHKGHVGNERADELAKEGSRETDPRKMREVKKPQAFIKSGIKQEVYREWQAEWDDSRTANHTKSFYGGPCSNKARYVVKLARLELGRFARVVTGHNNLNFFQNKIGLNGNRLCRFCDQYDETITHLMAACPCFINQQRELLGGLLPGSDMKWSVRTLLNFSYIPRINEAYEEIGQTASPPYRRVTPLGMCPWAGWTGLTRLKWMIITTQARHVV